MGKCLIMLADYLTTLSRKCSIPSYVALRLHTPTEDLIERQSGGEDRLDCNSLPSSLACPMTRSLCVCILQVDRSGPKSRTVVAAVPLFCKSM